MKKNKNVWNIIRLAEKCLEIFSFETLFSCTCLFFFSESSSVLLVFWIKFLSRIRPLLLWGNLRKLFSTTSGRQDGTTCRLRYQFMFRRMLHDTFSIRFEAYLLLAVDPTQPSLVKTLHYLLHPSGLGSAVTFSVHRCGTQHWRWDSNLFGDWGVFKGKVRGT